MTDNQTEWIYTYYVTTAILAIVAIFGGRLLGLF